MIKFVEKHRRYAELADSHTKAQSWTFLGKWFYWEVLRWRHWRDRFFLKQEAWEPEATFFANF